MGKLRKEGKSGTAANYLTRTQALKRLQLNLGDFRRLCILKGIYPREPKDRQKLKKAGKNAAQDQTFYHIRDIQIMQHEPLLDQFRELRAFAKKVKKLAGKEEWARLNKLEPPNYTLDHLIRERYPSFSDALEDCDDALSMIALFAQMPKAATANVNDHLKPLEKQRLDMARSCFSLMRHFEAWVMQSATLRKAFISVKGIYYQAEVCGKLVTWLAPLEFTTSIPSDVDFRIMSTFLEFYQTLIGFVNVRLFSTIGWTFPLKADESVRLEGMQPGSERPVLYSDLPASSVARAGSNLLAGEKVFLSREVPRRHLAFLAQSMGCESIGWASLDESSSFDEADLTITVQIIDRPSLPTVYPGRIYVQPQWLFDSLNAGERLDPIPYKVGAILPPHLSPFFSATEEPTETETKEKPIAEELEKKKLSLALLSKKRRKLYERIQHSRSRKSEEKAKLAAKKSALKA